MSPTRLSAEALPQLSIPTPTYNRSAVTAGIAHIGVGGFHRAHQANYVDRLLESGLGQDWGICGIGMLPGDARMRDALAAQDGLYTLVLKHPDGRREARVVGSIVEYLLAPDDPAAAVARLTDPAIRIVSLTVTEGGYNLNNATGAFAVDHPDVVHDVAEPDRPRTTFGLVVAALARRRAAGVPPFTVMSCDNVQGNGDVAQAVFSTFADLLDPDLGAWVREHVRFPNSMVDRITPTTTDADRTELEAQFGLVDAWPVVCEPFIQWVLEDHFGSGRPELDRVGVQLVDDVEPYEHLKLRLLNAAHQGLAYFGTLAGHTYVHETMTDPVFVPYLRAYWREAIPTLGEVPGVDIDRYCDQLVERFGNPEVADTNARLAFDGSERMTKFLLPVVRDRLAAGQGCPVSAAICASWARYCEGSDESGAPIALADQRAEALTAAAAQHDHDLLAFLRQRDVFGDLVERPAFTEPYLTALQALRTRGARATLTELLSADAR